MVFHFLLSIESGVHVCKVTRVELTQLNPANASDLSSKCTLNYHSCHLSSNAAADLINAEILTSVNVERDSDSKRSIASISMCVFVYSDQGLKILVLLDMRIYDIE